MDAFEKRLKSAFVEEAAQLLLDAEQQFLTVESAAKAGIPCPRELMDELCRLGHNLKGSSALAGYTELSKFVHRVECLLIQIRDGKNDVDRAGVLLASIDHLRFVLDGLKENLSLPFTDGGHSARLELVMGNAGAAAALIGGESATSVAKPAVQPDVAALMAQSEQSSAAAAAPPPAQSSGSRSEPPPTSKSSSSPGSELPPAVSDRRKNDIVRVNLDRLDELLKRTGELMVLRSSFAHEVEIASSLKGQMLLRELEKISNEIHQRTIGLRMAPIAPVFQNMNRIVRETSGKLNKKIRLEISGGETEVDRTVLERISDPLMHLIRNAVDHGIESGLFRAAAGKSEEGLIHLSARQDGGSIVIDIRDDGGGMDPEFLVAKAIEKKVLPPDTKLSPSEAYQLIFAPGFSTRTEVSDISGRGVGMDVVKTTIQQLRGNIQIETAVGKGTCFSIQLPLSLALLDGLIVRAGEERYVLPCSSVIETAKWEEEKNPAYKLSELLGDFSGSKSARPVAILTRDRLDRVVTLLVDEVLDQQPIIVQELDPEIEQLPWVMGGAILGDGSPSLILNVHQVLEAVA